MLKFRKISKYLQKGGKFCKEFTQGFNPPVSHQIDLTSLAAELSKLRSAMRAESA